MKKRIIAITAALMLFAAPAMAQIFMTDEDLNNRQGADDPSMYINLPGVYDSGLDWYAPVGEGLVVLAGLAGAYLFGKRRKEE